MKRELSITVQGTGREATVVIEGPGKDGRFRVAIDGVEREVDGRRVHPGTWSLIVDGKSIIVDLDQRRGHVAASVGTAEVALEVEDARHKRLRNAARRHGPPPSGERIAAPIAGKVVKVLVAAGDVVSAGQAVLVLEAMKMENELVAERGGTVSAIHTAAGQAVDTGDLLIELV